MQSLGQLEGLYKHSNLGGAWRRFDINGATKVDPNSIDDGSVDSGGQDGITTLSVDSPIDSRLLGQGLFWYMPIPLTMNDIGTLEIVLDFPDATSGATATQPGDNIYLAAGITSDPTDMANMAFGMGVEHGGSADLRPYIEQGAAQTFITGAALGRHFCGTILKSVGLVKKNACGHILNNSGAFVTGSFHHAISLTPSSPTDPLYIFLFVGRGGAGSFSRRVQMFYSLSKGYRIS